jgi:hypothetical protein
VQYSDIDPVFGIIKSFTEMELCEAPSRAKIVINTGDILIPKLKQSSDKIAIVTQEFDGCVATNGFKVIKPKDGKESELVFALFRNKEIQEQLQDYSSGTIMPSVDYYYFNEIVKLDREINEEKMVNKVKEIFELIDIAKNKMIEGDAEVKQEIEVLLGGGTLRKTISEDVVFGNIQETPDALWNFFLFSGYLKVVNKIFDDENQVGDFKIPNIEIKTIFKDSILYWFSKSQTYNKFNVVLDNLKKGRIKEFSKYFTDFIRQVCSYYDFAAQEPERVYHALVLGMMVQLQSEYRISSNRESGYGRYDVMLHPLKPALQAFVFEFKKFEEDDEESIQDTLSTAMQQMKTKNYASTLQQEGHTNIHLIAIAFKGKEVKMRYEEVF